MIEIDNISIKTEIGRRFKRFREAIGKTQAQLARELNVYQSTITNIEVGKTFPGIRYLDYLEKNYRLNISWLISSKGEMYEREETFPPAVSLLDCHIPIKDPRYEKYVELIYLMQVPVIEQVILAKLTEIKVIAKDELEEFQKQIKKLKKAQ
ncbi:MAG: helix-turn-helix domain-containing protein [Candidatus Aminicenantes bacterium]|nr:helix-turn-helix domain-containing protein [Candidatus Aminicenantes bacterium]NIM80082.1 helix-turn-helix domain-containing protein [Candidatus Aminicenantes bacterium]NIN19424.1 helix-turn-helix domain-containing protein [Candidatus Aminicenantes bacterium]NIN43323.1 helix-turn-helix domain-containing protein [Candidatus Aminicenantes bacterium]NIN86067.1 helix-turn-helix domain-containing protein [Candidatus Aminicenantes bacterium]